MNGNTNQAANGSGRVQVIDNYNYDMYKLFDENKKRNNFHEEAIKGVHTNNQLATIFFSQENIDALQDAMRYLVHKKSCGKYLISRQSDSELKLIMRAFYLQEGRHKQYNVMEEVRELNTMVLNYAVPRILQEVGMYMYYKQDINKNPMPMPRGEFVSAKGSKQLVTKEF
jgi:hypothetical protein